MEVSDPLNEYEQRIINELYPDPDIMTNEDIIRLQEQIGEVSKGMTKHAIAKLKLIKYDPKIHKNQENCVICMNAFVKNEEIRKIKCTHLFHRECIDEWLGREKKCPLCKKDVI